MTRIYARLLNYLLLLLPGAMLARAPQCWPRAEPLRKSALGIAAACWATLTICVALPDSLFIPQALERMWNLQRILYSLFFA